MTVGENQPLTLPVEEASVATLPTHALTATAQGPQLEAWVEGAFTFRTASGRASRLNVPAPPPPIEIKGPWTLHFQPGRGAGDHPARNAQLLDGPSRSWREVLLRLGYLLQVDRNSCRPSGCGPGTLPRPGPSGRLRRAGAQRQAPGRALETTVPRRIDGNSAVGSNDLSIRVTNRWPNRLIGDEQLPEDVEWAGIHLASWPRWLLEGTPRPSGRITFTTWHHWKKDDPLFESGLLGPVQLVSSLRVVVKPGP